MTHLHLLSDLAVLVGVAIPIVALAHRLSAPPVVGFLAAGVLIGPSGFALIGESEAVSALAELGVALLLFSVGLELSLSHLRRWARPVLLGGGLQVAGTLAIVAVVTRVAGVPTGTAIFYGALAAMSSTAIVIRGYADRGELETPPGRSALAILVFQDLCILPLILLTPVLADLGGADLGEVGRELGRGLAIVALLVVGGQFLVKRLLDRIVLLRDRELFTLCIGFVGIAATFLTGTAGFSLAIGAFIAGLMISESEYGLQALSDILPFRAMFSGIFFLSIGMLLDIPALAQRPFLILALLIGVLALKTALVGASVLAVGGTAVAALACGLSLAQVGEFSMVLAAAGLPLGLFREGDYQLFLSVAVLSMMATPFLIRAARPFASRLLRARGERMPEDEPTRELSDHTVVIGYGLAGRYLARVLDAAGIATIVVDQDAGRVLRAREDGINAAYGDGTQPGMLGHVGVSRARIVVFALESPTDERRGVAIVRDLNPEVRVIVSTQNSNAAQELESLGATDVIVEEFEASIELFAKALESYRIPVNRIWRETEAVRAEHYGLLRGTASPNLRLDALKHLGIHDALELVEIPEGARVTGENATTIDLRRRTGAVQVAVVRHGQPIYRRDPDYRYRPGDTIVLVGDAESLQQAITLFEEIEPGGGDNVDSAEPER